MMPPLTPSEPEITFAQIIGLGIKAAFFLAAVVCALFFYIAFKEKDRKKITTVTIVSLVVFALLYIGYQFYQSMFMCCGF